jgi:hypothetical protein
MSKSKMIVVRVDESLVGMIKATAVILERNESETIRILITRACKYWIARNALKGKDNNLPLPIKEQMSSIEMTSASFDEEEFKKLEALSKLLK